MTRRRRKYSTLIILVLAIAIGNSQDRKIHFRTELGVTFLNEVNAVVNFPIKQRGELDIKLGMNVNSRILSGKCGVFGMLMAIRVQEHHSKLGGLIDVTYLYSIYKGFRIGPQFQFRAGKADDVEIIYGCWSGSTEDMAHYNIDQYTEIGGGVMAVFGKRNDWINCFVSAGIRSRSRDLTKLPGPNDLFIESNYTAPTFNVGARIKLFSL